MGYKCRSSVTSINFDGSKLTFTFKSKTQFDCEKNNIDNNSNKYNILCDENKKDDDPEYFKGITEDEDIDANNNFLDLLQLAYEEEATFKIEISGSNYELKSLKVGRGNV